jgi:hypothetical protein
VTLVVGAFVVGIIALLVFVMGGKKAKAPAPEPEPEPVATPAAEPPKPKPPEAPPFPPVDAKVIEQAKAVAKKAADPANRAKRIYDEAMEAKRAGKDDVWQQKLAEADDLLSAVQDEWNEVIQQMPTSKDYDEEEVANHYVGKEGREITKALSLLPAIKKSLRLH